MYIREITFGRKLTTSIFKEGTGITTEFNHTFDLSSWLNSMIYKPIDYEEPIKVFKKSLEGKY
ncbi:hypothetical protein J2T12_002248 [Paenibacillus anaericanus]|nr:hypothetical protein [Paenibacillus anaericanus]